MRNEEALGSFSVNSVRGGNVRSFGNWKPERVVVIEFQSEEQIQKWLQSPEYRAIATLREEGDEAQAIMVDGCQKKE